MNRRVAAILLSLALLMTLCPAAVLATEADNAADASDASELEDAALPAGGPSDPVIDETDNLETDPSDGGLEDEREDNATDAPELEDVEVPEDGPGDPLIGETGNSETGQNDGGPEDERHDDVADAPEPEGVEVPEDGPNDPLIGETENSETDQNDGGPEDERHDDAADAPELEDVEVSEDGPNDPLIGETENSETDQSDGGPEDEREDDIVDASEFDYFEIPRIDPSNPLISVYDNSENDPSAVKPADNRAVNCIDRVKLPQFARDFYNTLVRESKPASVSGLGRDGVLIDPSKSSSTVPFYENNTRKEAYTLAIPFPDEASLRSAGFVFGDYRDFVYNCILAAFYAFDRDHPEVFWLKGGYSSSTNTVTHTFSVILAGVTAEGSENWDIRAEAYRNPEKIKNSIKALNSSVASIVSEANKKPSRYEKITYFNEWLATSNQYNYAVAYHTNDPHDSHTIYESIGALTAAGDIANAGGRTGNDGPVCESYARAFQLLCQQVDIPCVLVNNIGHMWNYAQADDSRFYAVDVTWNDPVMPGTPSLEEYTALGADSGSESTAYTLVGAQTVVYDGGTETFLSQHSEINQVTGANYVHANFKMGPELSELAYVDSVMISGLDAPVAGFEAKTSVTSRSEPKSGHHPLKDGTIELFDNPTVTWSPALDGNKFMRSTVYTATITCSGKRTGYGLTASDASKIQIAGVEDAKVTVNASGAIQVTFPETEAKFGQVIEYEPENVTCTYGNADSVGLQFTARVTVPESESDRGKISYAVTSGGDVIDIDATSGVITVKKAGTATVSITAAETKDYAKTTKNVPVTVNRATLTPGIVFEGTPTKMYDGTTTAPDGLSIKLNGIVGSDKVTATATYAYNSANVADANTITASNITLTGANAENYTLSSTTAQIPGVITKSTPVIAFSSTYNPDKTYDGQTIPNPTADEMTITGACYDDLKFTWSGGTPQNAGVYTLTASTDDTENTFAVAAETTVTINKATVTVTAENKAVTQDETLPEFTWAANGFFGSDDWATKPNISCTATDTGAVGSFSITVSGGNAGENYNITYLAGTLTVAPHMPVASPNGGSFTGSQHVTLTCATSGADIYYTTDGSTPTINSSLYDSSAGITLTATTTLKAIVFKDSIASGMLTVVFTRNSSGGGGSGGGGSGGGGSGGGGGSDGGAPTSNPQSVSIPFPSGQASIDISATISGSTAAVTQIDTAKMESAIREGLRAGKLELDFTGLGQSITAVDLPAEFIKGIVSIAQSQNSDAVGLAVKLTSGEIAFDVKALDAIQKQEGKQISLSISSVKNSDLNELQKNTVGNSPVFELTLKNGSSAITDLGGGYAKVSLPHSLNAGQTPFEIVVYHLDDAGKAQACDTEYDSDAKTVIFTTSHLSLYFVYEQFVDVSPSAWYANSVQYVTDRGLFGGVGSGSFAPNANMTRAMMWTVLARYMGVDTSTGSNWYEAAQAWAIAQGISDGTMAGGNVTREQFVTMLWRLSGEPAVATSASFTDGGSVSSYSKTAVDWAVAQGIVNGYSDGSFKPQGSATRAEVAKMLTVFCTNAEG